MQQPAQLDDLRDMSARVGRNILLVQGAGGNSSVKDGDVLWVKASGTWLADAKDKDIFVPVSLSAARAALERGDERVPLAPGVKTALRASIETSLHALMPHPVVLHVHSVNTIAWAVRTDASAELARRLRGLAWRFLDYCHPGLPLAQAVSETIAQDAVDVLILGNHGLVVGAATSEAAEALVADVEERLALEPREAPTADHRTLAAICAGTDYRVPEDPRCHGIAIDHHSLSVATRGSLYPDHVVFLGPAMPTMNPGKDLLVSDLKAVGSPSPVAALVPGVGSIIRKDASPGAEAMLICLALVTSRLPTDAEVTYLTAENERALLNWDAERYRQQLTANRST
ncbi:class II aldolase/adducin family protein [Bradyrhizobium sp. ISRA443]|uniref:class II aldolase/adducin family protein n=1 Tax=unclassified Bradyrhizobium TaxID=2631580 RepID=UPI002479A84B|nr:MULTISPECIES: class II aldolase/adducin family protein [unclassified Bradyrhizobium]WGR92678.1 class II aldolase/adducin family protein [Bradyrhizobium sp. ISRA435]WGR97117.1 class II aldolase/adducin family protein [Bradyrhizobium sp. ISRA436]WGS04005.1 class II aldolase/adducin family protein [Bradyrhizobium sp. ISRA437]WGS10888.1 class II aldolase/adducin family protein [Bradyrhizobium sp. ISRA443]